MSSKRVVDVFVPYEGEAAQRAAIAELCCQLVPEFNGMLLEDIQTRVLSGGNTNVLMIATSPKAPNDFAVVIRIYGPETERIISRDAERFVQSLFLRTYGQGKNALVYEFLHGYRTMEYDGLARGEYTASVARAIAQYHYTATGKTLLVQPYAGEELFCTQVHRGWVAQCLNKSVMDRIKEGKRPWVESVADEISREAAFLEETIGQVKSELPIAMCHNDILGGNVMLRASDGDIRLIDFEYTRRNYVYYDIANHFNEYAGFDCMWDLYPGKEHQLMFMREYAKTFAELSGLEVVDLNLPSDDRMYALLQLLSLSSHLCWVLWAILQEAYSTIDFDYIAYAKRRLERYRTEKVRVEALIT